MKNHLFVGMLFSLMFWSACSNDFDVSAPWRDIPVVYGLLDVDADVHYLRLEKAFLDPERSALDIAQNPDSLYYDNATVQLVRLSNGQKFTMTRVNGNDANIGFPRETGIFAQDPNWIYRLSGGQIDLKAGEVIELNVDRGNGLPAVTAQTTIQSSMIKRTPFGTNFDFVPNLETTIGWSASEAAKIFDVKLVFNYAEFPKDSPDQFVEKSLVWEWAKGITFASFMSEYKLFRDGRDFYSIVASGIPEDPNFKRIFINIDLIIESGGEELERYINVGLANSGVTGSQELPSYSNLSEGLGVFSTYGKLQVKGLSLSSRSRDSLLNGSLTKKLNFQ